MLQRQVIIHSIIYYKFNDNIWSDEQFDKACNELVGLKSSPEWKESEFHSQFEDFDGSTGCHLPKMFSAYMDHVANRLLKYHKTIASEQQQS